MSITVEPTWSAAEQAILAPREPISTAEWAEKHRWVTSGPMVGASGEPVRWSNEVFPLQIAIMDAIDDPAVPTVVVMASPQAGGKTECAIVNPILKRMHHDHESCLYVGPNALKAQSNWITKFSPPIDVAKERGESLGELVIENLDERGDKNQHLFKGGVSLYIAGSESVGNLSSSTIRNIYCDDMQAMPPTIGAYGHPVDLAMKRAGAFDEDERTLVLVGTAGVTDDRLNRELEKSTYYRPYVPCLKCWTYQVLLWERMQFDTSDEVAAALDCWMRCDNPSCKHHITDVELPAMNRRGLWVARGQRVERRRQKRRTTWKVVGDRPRVRTAGFWFNALYWPFTSWGGYAAAWVRSRGDPDMERDFQQHVEVRPIEPPKLDEDALEPAEIESHAIETHRWKTVPMAAGVHNGEGVLIGTADIQAGYLWYLVKAWHLATGTSWVVELGRFGKRADPSESSSDAERKALWRSRAGRALDDFWAKERQGWQCVGAGGEDLGMGRFVRAGIDCSFLRETVQTWCKLRNVGRWAGVWLPIEGSQCKAAGRVPVWPDRPQIEKRGGRRYWECNLSRAKLWVREMLAIPPGEPGAIQLPGDMPGYLRTTYAKHLCAEEWDAEKGKWVPISRENHLGDCEAMQTALAVACGVRLGALSDAPPPPTPAREPIVPRVTTPDGRPFLITER